MLSHNRTICIEALKVRHFHRVQRPMVPQEVEDISTKIILLLHRALGLIILSSMARRNRITVHNPLVLLQALLVLRISHTYLLLISQLAASISQVTEVNLTPHPRPTLRTNLHHHRLDHLNSDMAIAYLPRSDQTRDRNTQVLPQSYRIDSNHYLLCRLPSLRLRDRPIRRPLLRLHRSLQVEMRFHRTLPQPIHSLTRRESQHLEIQGKEYLVVRLPCIINYLLYRIIHRTAVLAFHLQLSIAGPLV